MILATDWVRLLIVCVFFTAAGTIAWAAGLTTPAPFIKAAVRAVLQLAVVSAVITFVLTHLGLTGVFLVVMAVVATAVGAVVELVARGLISRASQGSEVRLT